MIIDEAIGLSAVIINETVGDKINKANAAINYLNDLNAACLRLKRYTTSIINNSYKKIIRKSVENCLKNMQFSALSLCNFYKVVSV